MPRTYVSKSQKPYKKHKPETIQQAVDDVKNNVLSLRKAAEKYGIHFSVINRHLKKGNLLKPQGGQTALTASEEEILVNRLQVCSEWGYPVDTHTFRLIIKDFLDKKGKCVKKFKDNLPGREFVYSFLKRNMKQLSNRMCQNIKRSRAAVSPDIINDYFNNLEMELQGVPPQNIINYDETNLSDDPGRKKVITKRGCKYPERLINSTKTSISLMFSVAGNGEILPPYVVYKSLHLYQSWTEGGPKNTRYNRTKSGWFDGFCFEDWVTTIAIPYLRKQTGKRILIGDNLASHLTVDVIKKCSDNDIHLVFLPANSTHLTQPLDVAFFHPMKMAWRKILEEWKQGPGRSEASLPKDKFPGLLKKLLDQIALTGEENIKAGFKKCGIILLDRAPVLARLPIEADLEAQENDEQALDQSLVQLLKVMRYGDGTEPPKRKRRTKMNVVPGKSVVNDSSSSSDEDDFSLHNSESSFGLEDESEDSISLEEDAVDEINDAPSNTTMPETSKYPAPVSANEVKVGDWLLVNFPIGANSPGTSNSGQKPFIGQVKSLTNDGQFEGEFYRHRPSRDHQGYIYGLPNVPDVAEFYINQVIGRLNPPKDYQRGLKLFDINV